MLQHDGYPLSKSASEDGRVATKRTRPEVILIPNAAWPVNRTGVPGGGGLGILTDQGRPAQTAVRVVAVVVMFSHSPMLVIRHLGHGRKDHLLLGSFLEIVIRLGSARLRQNDPEPRKSSAPHSNREHILCGVDNDFRPKLRTVQSFGETHDIVLLASCTCTTTRIPSSLAPLGERADGTTKNTFSQKNCSMSDEKDGHCGRYIVKEACRTIIRPSRGRSRRFSANCRRQYQTRSTP